MIRNPFGSGETSIVLQCTVELTTPFSLWSKQAAHPPRRGSNVKRRISSRETLRTDAGLRVCLHEQISRGCCVSLLGPILKARLQPV